MSIQRKISVPRNGLVARQVIIYGIALIVVAAACYEFLVARPAFQKVFDRITELDLSNKAINMTADAMEKDVLQIKPVSIRHEELNNAEIRTYQWPSGIIFRPHTIHVVYSKGAVRTKDNEIRDNLYYYSSVANARVGAENLPGLKETIMKNRNLSGLGMGGGGGGGGDEDSSNEGGGNEDSGDGAEDEGNADDSSDSENEDNAADDSGKEEDGSAAPENKDQPPTEESGEQPADQPSEGEKPEEGDAGDDGQPAEGGDVPKEEDGKDGGGGGLNSPGFSTR